MLQFNRLCQGTILLVLVLCCLGVQSATPRCPEDGQVYTTSPSIAVQKSISVPTGTVCASGYTGSVLIDTNSGVVSFTQGLNYIFAPDASQGQTTATFTLASRCNGTTVCTASLVVNVVTPAPSTTTAAPTTTAVPATPAPLQACPASPAVTIPPMVTYYGQVTAPASFCSAYSARVTQSPQQGAVVFSSGKLQYIFAPPSTNMLLSFQYVIQCGQVDVCTGTQSVSVYAPTTAAPPVARCPKDQILMVVAPSTQVSDVLNVGATCDSPSGYVVSQPNIGTFTFTQGMRYMFAPPAYESNVIVEVEVRCNAAPFCRASVGFLVTVQTTMATTTTLPPTTSTVAPTPAPTPVPPTPAPPPSTCTLTTPLFYRVPVGTQFQNTLNVSLPTCNNIVTYRAVPSSLNGQFVINLVGSYIYAPPNAEVADQVYVDVGCVNAVQCRTMITFTTYFPITPVPTTTTPAPTLATTAAPLPSCANVYYYSVRTSQAISNSLSGMPGENACAYGRSFSVIRPVQQGTLVLTSSGDFSYTAASREGYFDFGFRMVCMGTPACEGSAFFQVSNAVTPAPVVIDTTLAPGVTTPAPTTAPPVILPNPQMTCRGTCNQQAWKVVPNKNIWDTTPGSGAVRSDGKAPDAIDVMWQNGSLVIKSYTYIGNVAVRFPTFEPFSATMDGLTPIGVSSQVAASSTAFMQSCLAMQTQTGMGEDVWKWTSIVNQTGRANTLYKSGDSWYQKFGGKHVNCDTFFNSCKYAPLLTPASPSVTQGTWTIDINNCDATWTGVFPAATLQSLVNAKGLRVWTNGGQRQLRGAIVTEAVRPTSWLDPNRGYDTAATPSNVILDRQEYATIRKVTPSDAFTFDSEYFEYLDSNGDLSFGVNLLFYSFVPPEGTSNYGSDRHVSGFKWISQAWVAPSNNQCPTCTGSKTQCTGSTSYAPSTFDGNFPNGDCPVNTGRIFLSKGPSMSSANCTADPVHVFNKPGISMTKNCTTNYQNLTIRGVATGSRFLTAEQQSAFTFEGSIQLQLLLDNGNKPIISLDLSLFVSRMSKGPVALAQGELGMCRASVYWPVLDPFGFSNPAQPLALSGQPAGSLCQDPLDRNFGPTGWVTMYLRLPNVKPSDLTVQLVKMTYGSTTVILLYRDPSTGLVTMPPAGAGLWWQRTHPFLNVRWLNDAVSNGTLTIDPNFVAADVPFAFTFTPGTISVDVQVELVVQATIRQQDPITGVVTTSDNTFTSRFHVDPLLTYESRNGPRPSSSGQMSLHAQAQTLLIPVSLLAVLLIALFIAKSCSNDEPLPEGVQMIFNSLGSLNPCQKKESDDHHDGEHGKEMKIVFDTKPKDMFTAISKEKHAPFPRQEDTS